MLNQTQADVTVTQVCLDFQSEQRAKKACVSIFPNFCEQQGDSASMTGEWWLATAWYNMASCVSVGRQRAMRYDAESKAYRAKAEQAEKENTK